MSESDVVLSAAKLFFAYRLGNGMPIPFEVGAMAVLLPNRPKPDSVLATMRGNNPTVFGGVPSLSASMLANPEPQKGAGSNRQLL